MAVLNQPFSTIPLSSNSNLPVPSSTFGDFCKFKIREYNQTMLHLKIEGISDTCKNCGQKMLISCYSPYSLTWTLGGSWSACWSPPWRSIAAAWEMPGWIVFYFQRVSWLTFWMQKLIKMTLYFTFYVLEHDFISSQRCLLLKCS